MIREAGVLADNVQAVFSMPFFHINESGALVISQDFWKYCVLAIPLSALCLGLWMCWQKRVFG